MSNSSSKCKGTCMNASAVSSSNANGSSSHIISGHMLKQPHIQMYAKSKYNNSKVKHRDIAFICNGVHAYNSFRSEMVQCYKEHKHSSYMCYRENKFSVKAIQRISQAHSRDVQWHKLNQVSGSSEFQETV